MELMRTLKGYSLVSLTVLLTLACGPTADPTLTPDIDATVRARMVQTKVAVPTPTPNIEATIQAGILQTKSAVPTPTPNIEATIQAGMQQTKAALPTPTPTLNPTATPQPTNTLIPTPTPLPSPTPNQTLTAGELLALQIVVLRFLGKRPIIVLKNVYELTDITNINDAQIRYFFDVMMRRKVLRRTGTGGEIWYVRY